MRDFAKETVNAERLYALIDEVARHPERATAVKHRIRSSVASVRVVASAPEVEDDEDDEDLWNNVPL